MEKIMNDYLEKIEKYLKPMNVSERIDIVKEIKSEMLELKEDGRTAEEIIHRLGDPKELARAYLGEAIVKNKTFGWKKISSLIAFYSLAGTVWMFVLPFTSIVGIAFMLSGILVSVAGVIKFVGYLLRYNIPYIEFNFGQYSANVITILPIAFLVGVVLFVSGNLLWKATIKIIKGISRTKEKIEGKAYPVN